VKDHSPYTIYNSEFISVLPQINEEEKFPNAYSNDLFFYVYPQIISYQVQSTDFSIATYYR
jgi:hypothetical protein